MSIMSFFRKLNGKDSERRSRNGEKEKAEKTVLDVDAAAKTSAPPNKAGRGKDSSNAKARSVDIKADKEASSGGLLGLKLVKGRKKSKVEAAPIDEEALGFSFKAPKAKDERRNAVRVSVEGLALRVDRVGVLPCINISATGAGFRFSKARFKHGVKLTLALEFQEKTVAEGIAAKVVRHDGDAVGVEFLELDRRQEDAVSKLVLVGQKQQAARRQGS